MSDRLDIPEEMVLALGDQRFDMRFDFFLCPNHGLIAPKRFDSEWSTDYGCPVPTYKEDPCDEHLTAVFLDSLVSALRNQGAEEAKQRMQTLERSIAEVERERDAIKMDPSGERILAAKDSKILELEAVVREAETERDQALAKGAEEERQRLAHGGEPDISPGDVIAAEPDGTITLDDGITTWNPARACAFLTQQALAKGAEEERERLRATLVPLLDRHREMLEEFRQGRAGSGNALSRIEGEIGAALDTSVPSEPEGGK
ncbi:MAG TPA: hypothetical protein VD761_11860 [Solirubrobacterales bacterium]|nr:hypothetical protein [Solirubrobacterales bacterium]